VPDKTIEINNHYIVDGVKALNSSSTNRNQKEYHHMELLFSLIGTSLSAAGFYAVHYIIKIAEKNES
jgi:hypothetical protein